VGCLAALEALIGRSAAEFDVYVGISAGSVVTSLVANGMSAGEIWSEMANGSGRLFGVDTGGLFRLAPGHAMRALRILPRLAGRLLTRRSTGPSAAEIIMSALSGLPSGLVDNSGVRDSMAQVLAARGTDSFAELGRKLYILAVELDTGRVVAFGERKWRHVPISTAIQASTAVPGLCQPVRIDGREYVDGAVLKTAHVRRAIREGARLVFCVTPAGPARAPAEGTQRTMLDVMEQSVRIMLRSRMQYALRCYRDEFPHVDVIALEPTRQAVEEMAPNCMRWSDAAEMAARGYRAVLETFRARADEYASVLARHGLTLRDPSSLPDARQACDLASPPVAPRLGRSLDLLDRTLSAG
jgi:predicted acylesterase/phospholipase RssA